MSEQKIDNKSNVDFNNYDTAASGTTMGGNVQSNADLGQYENISEVKDVGNPIGKASVAFLPENRLGEYLNRYVKLTSITVQNSDANLSLVTSFDPWQLLIGIGKVREKLNGFAYMRSGIDLLFVSAVPGNAQGLYAVTAVPEGYGYSPTVTQANGIDSISAHQCLNTDICAPLDISASVAVSMTLPWCLNTDYASVASCGMGSWTIRFFCVTGVQSGIPSGLTTGAYTVYAKMSDDLKLVVGRFEGKEDDKISSKVKKVGDAASMLSMIPQVNAFAAPAAAALNSAANIMAMFGYTRDNNVPKVQREALRGTSNVVNVDGEDSGDVTALSTINAISNEPDHNAFSTDKDELSFASLFDRWTAIGQYQWTPGLGAGTNFGNFKVAPLFCVGLPDKFYPTTGGYVGIPFQYWRGTMHYKVFISCSALHRGTIQVAYAPNNCGAFVSDVTNVLMNKIIDIQGSTSFEFSVGIGNHLFWYDNELIYSALTGNSANASNGAVHFFVVNPLKAPNTGSNVWVTVFAKCGSDMQFANPRDGMRFPLGTNVLSIDRTFQQNMWFEGVRDDAEEETAEKVIKFDLIPPAAPLNADAMMGEDIRSVRALVQKPSRVIMPATSTTGPVIVNYGRVYPYDSASSAEWTMQSHMRVMFMALASSEKYKLMLFTTPNTYWLSMGPRIVNPTQQINPLLNSVVPMTIDNAAEAVFPYYGPVRFVCAYKNVSDADVELRKNTFMLFNNAGTYPAAITNWCATWYSFGSDVRLSHFRITPVIRCTGAPPAAPARFL